MTKFLMMVLMSMIGWAAKPTQVVVSQLAPCSGTAGVLMFVPLSIVPTGTTGAMVCVQLDAASFVLDKSINPPVLRIAAQSSINFVNGEIPQGLVDGVNTAFSLVHAPGATLDLYRNGVHLQVGQDYTVSGTSITFLAGAIPLQGDTLVCNYRY